MAGQRRQVEGFSGKEALLDGLVGRVLADLPRPDPDGSWQQRLSAMAHAVRELAHRHPSIVPLLFSRPAVTADAVQVVDAIYQVLMDASVPRARWPAWNGCSAPSCSAMRSRR